MLTIGIPYYRNPDMLAEQYRVWAAYSDDIKSHVEVVIVDDGSPDEPAMGVPRPDGLPALAIYRVLVDIPWHQHGARNLAAKVAHGDWLLLTDMDHVVPAETVRHVVEQIIPAAAPNAVHTFQRVDAPKLTPTVNERGERKPHVNTFLIRRAHYWQVGGYDEDCVGYGTDGYFRNRMYAQSQRVHLDDVSVIRYPREVIADANTRPTKPMDPREFRNKSRRGQETRRRMADKGPNGQPRVLDFPWEQVL